MRIRAPRQYAEHLPAVLHPSRSAQTPISRARSAWNRSGSCKGADGEPPRLLPQETGPAGHAARALEMNFGGTAIPPIARFSRRRPIRTEPTSCNPKRSCSRQATGFPNNPVLPVLLYRQAIAIGGAEESASRLKRFSSATMAGAVARRGLFYHHYHSSAHEALGFAAGSARLMLGGR